MEKSEMMKKYEQETGETLDMSVLSGDASGSWYGYIGMVDAKATAYDRLMSGGKKTLKEIANLLGNPVAVDREGRLLWFLKKPEHDNPELMEESEIKWIPVSEKLPSHHLPVLVKDQYTPVNANYAVAYHNGIEWLPDIEAINIIGDAYTELCSQPTHWCEIKGKGEIS